MRSVAVPQAQYILSVCCVRMFPWTTIRVARLFPDIENERRNLNPRRISTETSKGTSMNHEAGHLLVNARTSFEKSIRCPRGSTATIPRPWTLIVCHSSTYQTSNRHASGYMVKHQPPSPRPWSESDLPQRTQLLLFGSPQKQDFLPHKSR
jgi:hypothetical protein